MKKKTILIYKKSNLLNSAGGIEKILSWLANSLHQQGYRVYVLTRDKRQGTLFYPLDKGIVFKHIQLKFSRLRRIIGQITHNLIPYFNRELYVSRLIRRYCDQIRPEVILTMGIQDLADIVYHDPYPCQKIVQLHSAPCVFFTKKKTKLFVKTLKSADIVQVLMPSFKKMLRPFYAGKIVVIGNPVAKNTFPRTPQNIIIYPARIERNKRQDVLIEAFQKIASQFPDWQVHLWGGVSDFQYNEFCQNLIHKFHLENQVKLMGVSKQMAQKLSQAAVCAFPSNHEGFSLSLTEAMAASLPCVGFQDAPSVNEMIHHNENGFLVSNVLEFSKALETLMKNPKLRQSMGKRGLLFVQNYTPKKVLKETEQLFQ
mgnify:CR=1 FL=1